jgi:hypothetical protein
LRRIEKVTATPTTAEDQALGHGHTACSELDRALDIVVFSVIGAQLVAPGRQSLESEVPCRIGLREPSGIEDQHGCAHLVVDVTEDFRHARCLENMLNDNTRRLATNIELRRQTEDVVAESLLVDEFHLPPHRERQNARQEFRIFLVHTNRRRCRRQSRHKVYGMGTDDDIVEG